jgi:hypothetical protein
VSGGHAGPAHEGKSRTMGMHAGEESDGCIVPVKRRTMPSDIGGGDGGGKAAGRGEGELQRMRRTQRWTKHVTDAASPRIGAAWVPHTPKADHVRPETGAGCGKAARPDLRGGRGAILVPTATIGPGGCAQGNGQRKSHDGSCWMPRTLRKLWQAGQSWQRRRPTFSVGHRAQSQGPASNQTVTISFRHTSGHRRP